MCWYILVLTVLGTVGGETEGLVGHELLGAGVNGSSNGDARVEVLVRDKPRHCGCDGIVSASWEIVEVIYQRTYPRTRPVNN